MRAFVLGFVAATILIPAAAVTYVRLGFVDPRADIPVSAIEQRIAMPSLDASVERRAPRGAFDRDASDTALVAGMKTYEAHCASCHGDGARPDAALATALYPRPPQFVREAPDMPAHENFYIIKHGIRMSGMPAWGHVLSDREMRELTAFLSHMDRLPAPVDSDWKAGVARSR
ncbi:MAG: cytochrome c [Gemmatimonadota bacterium]|nr:cytochrome c [Gemmatimonadota bacterium]